jgi:hypothetical protein
MIPPRLRPIVRRTLGRLALATLCGALLWISGCAFGYSPSDPECWVSPDGLAFGSVNVGESETLAFTVQNVGAGTLEGSVTEECPNFSIVMGAGDYSLGSGQMHAVMVRFAPSSSGAKACQIELGGTRCPGVPCSGSGIAGPECQVTPTSLDFGEVPVDMSADLAFSIKNVGGGVVTGSVSEYYPDFSIVSGGGDFSLSSGRVRTVTVRFAPTSLGEKHGAVNTGTVCANVGLTGIGTVAPHCSVVPDSLYFGPVMVGESLDMTFRIANTGGGTISGYLSENCPDYSIVSVSGAFSLGAGESMNVTVRFSPASNGSKKCSIDTGAGMCSDVGCAGFGTEMPPR